MKKNQSGKKVSAKQEKPAAVAYRMRCPRTANGLSHYVPAEKKALV
ncbi:MAG: hypothetical protein V1662_04215 [Candidatus Omnitrophota bacterium]